MSTKNQNRTAEKSSAALKVESVEPVNVTEFTPKVEHAEVDAGKVWIGSTGEKPYVWNGETHTGMLQGVKVSTPNKGLCVGDARDSEGNALLEKKLDSEGNGVLDNDNKQVMVKVKEYIHLDHAVDFAEVRLNLGEVWGDGIAEHTLTMWALNHWKNNILQPQLKRVLHDTQRNEDRFTSGMKDDAGRLPFGMKLSVNADGEYVLECTLTKEDMLRDPVKVATSVNTSTTLNKRFDKLNEAQKAESAKHVLESLTSEQRASLLAELTS